MSSDPIPRDRIRLLFVCLGGVCRSPLACAAFEAAARSAGLEAHVETAWAGVGDWFAGQAPDARAAAAAARKGWTLGTRTTRQVTAADLSSYDHLLVMDKDVLHDVLFLDQEDGYGGRVQLLRLFDPEPGDYQVPDPYHGTEADFDAVAEIVERAARGLAAALAATAGRQGHGAPGDHRG